MDQPVWKLGLFRLLDDEVVVDCGLVAIKENMSSTRPDFLFSPSIPFFFPVLKTTEKASTRQSGSELTKDIDDISQERDQTDKKCPSNPEPAQADSLVEVVSSLLDLLENLRVSRSESSWRE